MSTITKTLKLPFLRLNRAKADEFACLQILNTSVENGILTLSPSERRTLTSKAFVHVDIGSAWINQTIRNANARTKVRQFRCLPLETNNQNWTLHKVGDTYSVSFGLRRGIKKRVPLAVHHAGHQRRCNAGIRLEDLSGIRQRSRQRRTTKTDAGQNRDSWPFFQLEQCITYKAQIAGIVVEHVPAAYTSQSCHHCGVLGTRKKHTFLCPRCAYHAHADANAAQNIRDWYGMRCPLVLEAPVDWSYGTALNTVRNAAA